MFCRLVSFLNPYVRSEAVVEPDVVINMGDVMQWMIADTLDLSLHVPPQTAVSIRERKVAVIMDRTVGWTTHPFS